MSIKFSSFSSKILFFRYDQTIHNLDVLVDFISERKEVREAQGPNYPFSFGDYVVKSLIGSIDPQLGNLVLTKIVVLFFKS